MLSLEDCAEEPFSFPDTQYIKKFTPRPHAMVVIIDVGFTDMKCQERRILSNWYDMERWGVFQWRSRVHVHVLILDALELRQQETLSRNECTVASDNVPWIETWSRHL